MMSEDMDPVGRNKPVEVPDPKDSSTMVTLSGQQRREPLVGDLVSSPESVVMGGENARDSVAVGLGGNGTSENVGSDSEIGSAKEGIEAVFSGARYGRPPLGCLTPSLESVGSRMEKKEDAVFGMDIYRLERNGAREIAGSDLEDVFTGDWMGTKLSGTGNTKPLVEYWNQLPESGRDPGYQVRGAHLKKLRRTEGGAKIGGVFRVKKHIFFQF
jgi:hypothetical protein